MTDGAKVWQGIQASMNSGTFLGERAYDTFSVAYLRPLAPGETRAKPEPSFGSPIAMPTAPDLVGTL